MAAGRVAASAALLCAVVTACGGARPTNDSPSATVAVGRPGSTTTTTTAPDPTTTTTAASPAVAPASTEQQVEAAYLRSWDVYTDAMLRLDPARLDEVYAGDALDLRRGEIDDAPHPVRVRVEHDYEVAVVAADTALVFETYRNHSVYLDAATMQPVEPDPNNVLKREYVLQQEPAGWRVTQVNAGS